MKIPYLPESDTTHEISEAKLRDIYTHVKEELPKKGQRKQKQEAKAEGEVLKESPPQLPILVKTALDQFYNHYKNYFEGVRKQEKQNPTLFTPPPVFIVVCNNTSASKEAYKFIAGYEYKTEGGEIVIKSGHYDLFSNYDPQTLKPREKPPPYLLTAIL